MDISWDGVLRRAHRGQRGSARALLLAGVGAAGTLGSLIAMNPAEKVAAAEQTACAYEHRVVLTAIEADRATNSGYAAPSGPDGLGGVRQAGFLLTESKYWVYQGLDQTGRPALTPRTEKPCDTGVAEALAGEIERIEAGASVPPDLTTVP